MMKALAPTVIVKPRSFQETSSETYLIKPGLQPMLHFHQWPVSLSAHPPPLRHVRPKTYESEDSVGGNPRLGAL